VQLVHHTELCLQIGAGNIAIPNVGFGREGLLFCFLYQTQKSKYSNLLKQWISAKEERHFKTQETSFYSNYRAAISINLFILFII